MTESTNSPMASVAPKTARGLVVLSWVLGVLFALVVAIVLARRPLANFFFGRASHAEVEGNNEAALRNINIAMILSPSDFKNHVHYLRYQYRHTSGDTKGALEDLNAMIQRDPGWRGGDPYHARGAFYMNLELWDAAIADYHASAQYSQNNPFVAYQLGQCYRQKGDLDSAKRYYREAESGGDPSWSMRAREALQNLP